MVKLCNVTPCHQSVMYELSTTARLPITRQQVMQFELQRDPMSLKVAELGFRKTNKQKQAAICFTMFQHQGQHIVFYIGDEDYYYYYWGWCNTYLKALPQIWYTLHYIHFFQSALQSSTFFWLISAVGSQHKGPCQHWILVLTRNQTLSFCPKVSSDTH